MVANIISFERTRKNVGSLMRFAVAAPLNLAFRATASRGIAALTSSSALPRRLAPESGSRGFFSPGPHTTRRAGPHRAVPKDKRTVVS